MGPESAEGAPSPQPSPENKPKPGSVEHIREGDRRFQEMGDLADAQNLDPSEPLEDAPFVELPEDQPREEDAQVIELPVERQDRPDAS